MNKMLPLWVFPIFVTLIMTGLGFYIDSLGDKLISQMIFPDDYTFTIIMFILVTLFNIYFLFLVYSPPTPDDYKRYDTSYANIRTKGKGAALYYWPIYLFTMFTPMYLASKTAPYLEFLIISEDLDLSLAAGWLFFATFVFLLQILPIKIIINLYHDKKIGIAYILNAGILTSESINPKARRYTHFYLGFLSLILTLIFGLGALAKNTPTFIYGGFAFSLLYTLVMIYEGKNAK